MKLNKCKCGSCNLEVFKGNDGLTVRCKDCGNSETVKFSDEFTISIYSKLVDVANSIQQDHLVMKWNNANDINTP